MGSLARTVQTGIVIPVIVSIFLAGGASAHAQAASAAITPLVHYTFDDDLIDTGPDTFSVFQHGKGTISLNTVERFRGYRSVQIRDVAGDHDFPELQGHFPIRAKGKLYLHFALMTTDVNEELNIALAGPRGFHLGKDGIALWLKTAGGYLTEISDSMPKKLFPMRAFVWYVVDADYDIDAGTYDLTLHQEGVGKPVVEMREQPNAASQSGSQIDTFSFVGDPVTDESNVVYYVDDVLLGVSEAVFHLPFVAPGRHRLFFDYWSEARHARAGRPAPLALMSLADLGISSTDAAALREGGAAELLGQALSGKLVTVPDEQREPARQVLESVIAWHDGADELASGDARSALAQFDRAARLSRSAPLIEMDAVMALASLGRWNEADLRLANAAPLWRDDPRLPSALAALGLARGDLDAVVVQLCEGAELNGLMAEEYFMALLWKGDSIAAEQFASAMLARTHDSGQSLWRERLGDAAFLAGNMEQARERYEASLAGDPWPSSAWLKLSDVYYKLGDLEKERTFRERVYGGLRER